MQVNYLSPALGANWMITVFDKIPSLRGSKCILEHLRSVASRGLGPSVPSPLPRRNGDAMETLYLLYKIFIGNLVIQINWKFCYWLGYKKYIYMLFDIYSVIYLMLLFFLFQGFLIESKLRTLLQPLEKDEQSLMRLDAIFSVSLLWFILPTHIIG